MTTENPATPPTGATPGNNEPGSTTQPPTTTPPAGAPPEGHVTISTKEYAELQRAKARTLSAQKRQELTSARAPKPGQGASGEPEDEVQAELSRLRMENQAKDQLLMKERLTNRVRSILDKDEFKALPSSTRKLIEKNPSILSKADNEEEALLDIEDYIREEVAGLTLPPSPSSTKPTTEPLPKVNAGSPSGPADNGLEDVSRLRGDERILATFRNVVRAKNDKK